MTTLERFQKALARMTQERDEMAEAGRIVVQCADEMKAEAIEEIENLEAKNAILAAQVVEKDARIALLEDVIADLKQDLINMGWHY